MRSQAVLCIVRKSDPSILPVPHTHQLLAVFNGNANPKMVLKENRRPFRIAFLHNNLRKDTYDSKRENVMVVETMRNRKRDEHLFVAYGCFYIFAALPFCKIVSVRFYNIKWKLRFSFFTSLLILFVHNDGSFHWNELSESKALLSSLQSKVPHFFRICEA